MLSGDWLCIEGIYFRCVIGVTERERQIKQDILVNVDLKVDFNKAASSDSIHDAVDYRTVSGRVAAVGEQSSFQLVESLATHLCKTILDEFPKVQAVRIEVEKPGALRGATTVRAVIVSHRDAL